MKSTAIVLLSGGQDSATCLALAQQEFDQLEAISFDYGQRHKIELKMAEQLAHQAGIPHHVIDTTFIQTLSTNALTQSDVPIELQSDGLPNTFVPGRNALFLTIAASYAYQKGIRVIYTGVCETDYSGYPDCRAPFIDAITHSINLAMDSTFEIRTPLMHKTKSETVLMMKTLGKLDWYAHTLTCYEGQQPACGKCPACKLRLLGFQNAGIPDPLAYQ